MLLSIMVNRWVKVEMRQRVSRSTAISTGGGRAPIRACRICRERPLGAPLPHEPRPVLRVSPTATVCIVGQAPGTRVHASGMPFTDPSGDRLRAWLGLDADTFYDVGRIAIVPMGFCFPGQDARGADLPPRRECAPAWRAELFAALPQIELVLAVGSYAHAWHLGPLGARDPDRDRRRLARDHGRHRPSDGHPAAPSVVAQQCLDQEEPVVRGRTAAGPAGGRSPTALALRAN